MRALIWSALWTLALAVPPGPVTVAEAGELTALFNGKDLEGWGYYLVEPDVAKEAVWSVQDGILVCKGEPLGYLYTLSDYTSFALVVEWRWAPGTEPGNSGVLMRIGGEPRAVPRAYEAQLKSGDAGDVYGFWGRPLSGDASRMRTATGHDMLGDMVGFAKTEGHENPPGEWNRYEIRFDGPHLVVRVNGHEVNEATGAEVVAGPIGLQSEGGEIHFRKVELTPLD
jgi:hypothetical protein